MSKEVHLQLPADITPDELLAVGQKLADDPAMAQIADQGEWVEALAKAVAAHRSHLQQRTRSGRFIPYNPRREQPRGTSGRFVKRLTPEERTEAARLAQSVRNRFDTIMARHLGDIRASRIDSAEASMRGREDIGEYYEQIFRRGMQAAGNPAILLTPRDRAALSRIVRDESDFWTAFMGDVAAGRGTIDYDARQSMYTNAAQESFWMGWVLGDMRPRRRITWRLGETDHCETCFRMARRGEMSPEEFVREGLSKGYLPQSGYLNCRGINCQCYLEEGVAA